MTALYELDGLYNFRNNQNPLLKEFLERLQREIPLTRRMLGNKPFSSAFDEAVVKEEIRKYMDYYLERENKDYFFLCRHLYLNLNWETPEETSEETTED